MIRRCVERLRRHRRLVFVWGPLAVGGAACLAGYLGLVVTQASEPADATSTAALRDAYGVVFFGGVALLLIPVLIAFVVGGGAFGYVAGACAAAGGFVVVNIVLALTIDWGWEDFGTLAAVLAILFLIPMAIFAVWAASEESDRIERRLR